MFFFNRFPTIQYANTVCTDIFAKVKLTKIIQESLQAYYTYTLVDGERPDHTAEFYYKNSSNSWVLYLANGVVDPYYDWLLSDLEFQKFIERKYGSIGDAQARTMMYQCNYEGDSQVLSTSAYEALPAVLRKYWSPSINEQYQVYEYRRKQLDLQVETNKVINCIFTVQTGDNSGIEVGDLITQYNTQNYGAIPNSTEIASGEISLNTVTSRGYEFMIKNITGEFQQNYVCQFRKSEKKVRVTKVYDIHQPIQDVEAVYWSPVSYYEYEEMKNKRKQEILVIDETFIPRIEENMFNIFK